MKLNYYYVFCSVIAKAEPAAMASSSSTGATGDGSNQWVMSGGSWTHPFYGTYESWHGGHQSGGKDKPSGDAWKGDDGWKCDEAWKDDAWSRSKWSESGWAWSWQNWWETKDGDGTTDVDMSGTNNRVVVRTPIGATPKQKAFSATTRFDSNDNGDIPMENDVVKAPTTYDDEEWEEETEAVIQAKSLFWGPEKLVRLNTGALTPFEVHQLKESFHPSLLADINKVINHFGEASGPTRAARTLLKTIAEGKCMVPGSECPIDSPEFSICKHLLLGAWDGMPVGPDCGFPRCNCFPRTSLMPRGCVHNPVPIWKATFYYQTLCRHCSECVRCGGYLGNILLSQLRIRTLELASGIGIQDPRTIIEEMMMPRILVSKPHKST